MRWGERMAPLTKAHDAELRAKLKAIDAAPRSPLPFHSFQVSSPASFRSLAVRMRRATSRVASRDATCSATTPWCVAAKSWTLRGRAIVSSPDCGGGGAPDRGRSGPV